MGGNPPPIPRFCHRRFGFRRSFASPTLSRGGARPIGVIRRLFTVGRHGPRVACRLLQPIRFASTTTDGRHRAGPHRRSPTGAAFRKTAAFRRGSAARGDAPFGAQPAEMSRARGTRTELLRCARHLSPRSLTVKASPQPDRLGHLVSRARDGRRLENLRRRTPA